MPNDLVQAAVVLESANRKFRYTIGVSDDGKLVATMLVFRDGQWSDPRPEVGRKNLAYPDGQYLR